ncbi:MAG: hypothetical protein MSC30_11060 [Gaiellaceae bacterium MAG52_C11]|nr:hypothetical protein [Candidatus Gaiellasilicea maunaloa]
MKVGVWGDAFYPLPDPKSEPRSQFAPKEGEPLYELQGVEVGAKRRCTKSWP